MSKTIEISDQNTSKASQQIKDYILHKQATETLGSLEVYKITLAEVRKNFKKLSKVYRLLMISNADQIAFFTQK